MDNAVDPATNTVKLRARFSNSGQTLWPGQFAKVVLTLGESADAIVVPDAAVKAGPDGRYVFVVMADGHVEQRGVSVARSVDGDAVIAKGLAAGESVVTDGQSRLVNGGKVKVVGSSVGVARSDVK